MFYELIWKQLEEKSLEENKSLKIAEKFVFIWNKKIKSKVWNVDHLFFKAQFRIFNDCQSYWMSMQI